MTRQFSALFLSFTALTACKTRTFQAETSQLDQAQTFVPSPRGNQVSECLDPGFKEKVWALDRSPRFEAYDAKLRPCIDPSRKYIVPIPAEGSETGAFSFANLMHADEGSEPVRPYHIAFQAEDIDDVIVQKQMISVPFGRTDLEPLNWLVKLLKNEGRLTLTQKDGQPWRFGVAKYYHSQLRVRFKRPIPICDLSGEPACSQNETSPSSPSTRDIVLAGYPAVYAGQDLDYLKGVQGSYSAVRLARTYDSWKREFFKGSKKHNVITQWRMTDEAQAVRLVRQFVKDSSERKFNEHFAILGHNCSNILRSTLLRSLEGQSPALGRLSCQVTGRIHDAINVYDHFTSAGVQLEKMEDETPR